MTRRQPHLAAAFACLTLATTNTAQTKSAEWKTFEHLTAAQKERVALQIEQQLPDSPLLQSLRACRHASATPHAERTKLLVERHGKRALASETAASPTMPQNVRYVFGVGTLEQLKTKGAGKKPTGTDRPPEERAVEVQQALLGMLPGSDRALAMLLHGLDRDTHADEFAAFLHAWRNGEESFYEALDRTAGTKHSVFFYDAMLGDFRTLFDRGDADGRPLRGSLQMAHDALHTAFLTYRQYRGFREAVAWSLVLPPQRSLPPNLRRYETAADGAYSLRQQVVMVCHLFDSDAQRVQAEIVRTAAALPQPLWQGAYDPFVAWNALFAAQLPHMIEAATSSDAFLAGAIAVRTADAEAVAQAARTAIEAEAKANQDDKRH